MRILIDLTSIYDKLSGIEKYALNIAKHMVLNDKENEYVLIFKNEIHEAFSFAKDRENVKCKVFKTGSKLLGYQLILPIYLYMNKCDVYLFLAFQAPVLFFSKKIVNAVHDMTPWLFPETMSMKGLWYFRIMITMAMLKSKFIISISESAKKDISKFFKNKNIEIVYCGVDSCYDIKKIDNNKIQSVSEKYKLPDRYMLCLATLEPRKNLGLLVEAYSNLRLEGKIDYKLVLVGRSGWKYDTLMQKSQGLLGNEIVFTGFVDECDLPYVYYLADCFIFPSIYEGFGMPPLEAMSMGVPVISSDASSLPEVIGDNGFLFKNNNLEDLEEKILKFVNKTEEQLSELSQHGLDRAKLFKWDNESFKLIKLLENTFGECKKSNGKEKS